MHVWNFQPVWAHADLLVLGLANTLKVTAAALFFGMPLGLTLALMRLSQAKVFKWPSSLVIEQGHHRLTAARGALAWVVGK